MSLSRPWIVLLTDKQTLPWQRPAAIVRPAVGPEGGSEICAQLLIEILTRLMIDQGSCPRLIDSIRASVWLARTSPMRARSERTSSRAARASSDRPCLASARPRS
jgi:hypothetical protein